jgi:hypothetical protein
MVTEVGGGSNLFTFLGIINFVKIRRKYGRFKEQKRK